MSIMGTFSFPDVREPLAGVKSFFPGFDAFREDGNLQKFKDANE